MSEGGRPGRRGAPSRRATPSPHERYGPVPEPSATERARRALYGVFRTYDQITDSPLRRGIARTGPVAPYLALLVVWGLAVWRVVDQLHKGYPTGFNLAWSAAIVAAAIVGTVWWWQARPRRRPPGGRDRRRR